MPSEMRMCMFTIEPATIFMIKSLKGDSIIDLLKLNRNNLVFELEFSLGVIILLDLPEKEPVLAELWILGVLVSALLFFRSKFS